MKEKNVVNVSVSEKVGDEKSFKMSLLVNDILQLKKLLREQRQASEISRY